MVTYQIEDIKHDHPELSTANLVACTVARCRGTESSPWLLAIECQRLPGFGGRAETCELQWWSESEANARNVEKTYQSRRITEDAAIGVCAAVFAALKEGVIDEVTANGTGVDYWVDSRRAVLEISGIEKGDPASLSKRHREKTEQLRYGRLFAAGHPGYAFAIAFGAKVAILSYHS